MVAGEADRLKQEVRAAIRAGVRAMLLVGAALFLLLTSLLFVMLGAYDSMAFMLPPWLAGVIVALGAVVLALLLLAIVLMGGRRRRSRRERAETKRLAEAQASRREDLRTAVELGASASAAAGGAAREFLRSHRPSGFGLVISALVAGLVAARASGRRPPRRGEAARDD